MDNVSSINPRLAFPVGVPFEVPDQFNGHQRGTWYYRDPFNWILRGPFRRREEAAYYLDQEEDGG